VLTMPDSIFSMDVRVTPAGLAFGARRRIAPTLGWTAGFSAKRWVRRVCDNFLYKDQGLTCFRTDANSVWDLEQLANLDI
jgi:hypothetical protein